MSNRLTREAPCGYLRAADLARRPGSTNPTQILPISHSTLWRWVRCGRFPRPIHLSPGVAAWHTEVVLDWMQTHSVGEKSND
jgi:prophage regulatory protein